MTERTWTPEQLGKWRIRKARPGELPPWADRVDPEVAVETPWWVWKPGGTEPDCCVASWQGAMRLVEYNLKADVTVPSGSVSSPTLGGGL